MKKLIVITPEQFLPDEADALNHIAETATQYTCAELGQSRGSSGVEVFLHIRKPDAERNAVAALLNKLSDKALERVMLHEHFSLLEHFRVRGIHRNTKNAREFETYRTKANCLSYAAHSVEEITGNDGYDYYWLSPIFASISKTGYESHFTLDELKPFLAEYQNKRVVALGGITAENANQCLVAGFAGIAVLGWLWTALDQGGMALFASKVDQLCKTIAH